MSGIKLNWLLCSFGEKGEQGRAIKINQEPSPAKGFAVD